MVVSPCTVLFQSTHSVGSGTLALLDIIYAFPKFQSTHSVGSGTSDCGSESNTEAISIHPLRGEWDKAFTPFIPDTLNFNPPTPWGVGLPNGYSVRTNMTFQSTHSVGSGTGKFLYFGVFFGFQSTHSVGSGTCDLCCIMIVVAFQSTHSVGSGTKMCALSRRKREFQSTHSVGSGTAKLHKKICNFYTKQTMLPIRFAFCARMIAKRARILFICSRFFARTSPVFYVHLWFASDSQKAFRFIRLFRSVMLNLCLIVIPEIIKSQAIFVFIHDRKQFML